MMSDSFQAELEDIITKFSILSPNSYSLQHRKYSITINDNKDDDSNSLDKLFILYLGNKLYQICHCRQKDYNKEMVYENSLNSRDFIESLSNANTGTGTWESGWEINKIEKNGQIAVHKHGLTLWVTPHQFISDGGDVQVGTKGRIAMVKEFRSLLPGFYMANGNSTINQSPILTRIYWNVDVSAAVSLMRCLTTELNNEKVPFQFKILSNPNDYTRIDTGILYMNKRYLGKTRNALKKNYEQIKPFLKSQTPLFAKRLAPGVSLAEDPNNGESFGQHRTRLLAEVLHSLGENNNSTKDEKMKKVSTHFKNSGVDINEPYINSGSTDDYEIILKGVFN